jgi:ubiquinone biosynthesis protein COQ9
MEIPKLQEDILRSSLEPISKSGWNLQSLYQGATSLGYDSAMVDYAFPQGLIQAFEKLNMLFDQDMLHELQKLPLAEMKVTAKVTAALQIRFRLMDSYKPAFRAITSAYLYPPRPDLISQSAYQTASCIWYGIEDTSTDFNYYTKRLLLSTVYGLTFSYWIAKEDSELEKTYEFMEKRLQEVTQIPKVKAQVKSSIKTFSESCFSFIKTSFSRN